MNTVTTEVAELLGTRFINCESPSLRLDKYLTLQDKGKRGEIEAVIECHRRYAQRIPAFVPPEAGSFVAKLEGKLIINQSGGVLENAGMCLHRHYGTPYIPGSAVKGIARHAAWCEWFAAKEPERSEMAEKIATIFGYPTGDKDQLDSELKELNPVRKATAGKVAFLPATPVDKAKLSVDIVTCHHPEYYRGEKPVATDDESPNPQEFPVVEAGSEWCFTLIPIRRGSENNTEWLEQAKEWLLQGITMLGVGGKTAAGYGWFSYDKAADEERIKKLMLQRELDTLVSEFEDWKKEHLNALDQVEPNELTEVMSMLEKECFAFKERFALLDRALPGEQLIRDLLNLNRKRIPKAAPEDVLRQQWQTMNQKAILNSHIKRFKLQDNERKRAIVVLLRESEGVGYETWQALKAMKLKGDLANAVMEIRVFCRDTLQQGKMP